MSPPLLVVAFQELRDLRLRLPERVGPAAEERPAGLREPIRAPRRARQLRVPLRLDDPVLLERAEEAVEVADVDPLVAEELRELLDQLVAVARALREQEEDSRLDEPFDA